MKPISLNPQSRDLLPAWSGCVSLQLPAIILSRSDDGVPWHFASLSLGCAGLVAYAFRHDIQPRMAGELQGSSESWRERMTVVGAALLAAVAAFALLCLGFGDEFDLVALIKALYVAALAFCIVPAPTLVTRKPLAAVTFGIMLVLLVKLIGCMVVVFVHGWQASDLGYTETPWTHPNLLVWFFWCGSGMLSVWLYLVGRHKFINSPNTGDSRTAVRKMSGFKIKDRKDLKPFATL